MTVEEIIEETPDIKTLRLKFQNPEDAEKFDFKAGQFGEYSVFGEGECTFCIASPPTRKEFIECSFKLTGKVTAALRNVEIGDTIGFRGPYGNNFPIEDMYGKNVYFISGGIGLAPVRCLILNCLDLRDKFKDVTIIYGSRTVDDMVYKHELEEWEERDDCTLWRCIDWSKFGPDGPIEEPSAEGWAPVKTHKLSETDLGNSPYKFTAFVPQMVEVAAPKPENSVAVVCGPPVMIKFTLNTLRHLGFKDNQIITTLENRMKCGLGKCGRCNIGKTYVCKDGPVFTAEELNALPDEF